MCLNDNDNQLYFNVFNLLKSTVPSVDGIISIFCEYQSKIAENHCCVFGKYSICRFASVHSQSGFKSVNMRYRWRGSRKQVYLLEFFTFLYACASKESHCEAGKLKI